MNDLVAIETAGRLQELRALRGAPHRTIAALLPELGIVVRSAELREKAEAINQKKRGR